jgi:hypothetical protein
VSLDLRQMLKKGKLNKKPSDMTFAELLHSIRNVRQAFPDIQEKNVARMRAKMAVDASQRLALALSCFSFTLLAIPLGIRSHRKESSIGIGMALVLLFLFYLFIIIGRDGGPAGVAAGHDSVDSGAGLPDHRGPVVAEAPLSALFACRAGRVPVVSANVDSGACL